MEYAIETRGLSRRHGRIEAIRELNLQVPAGSVFALIGPNGAGKTTAIKVLVNLLAPTLGTAEVLGVDSRRLGPADLRRIGYVAEDQVLPPLLTLSGLADYCRPFYPTWDQAFADGLRRRLDIPTDRRVFAMSRGAKMKAALLLALAYHPELLILDEPFSGLDPLVREELSAGVLELTQQGAWTVFVSSHDVDEVERLADWIGILNNGHLDLAEPVATLLGRFRQVDAALDGPATLPPGLPESWLAPAADGHTVRFVESSFSEEDLGPRVRSVWPSARDITATPMPLKAVFVALARSYRLSN